MEKYFKIIFLISILFISNFTYSQVKFQKVYGGHGYDYGYTVIQTYDKGYAVAGATTTIGNGSTDAYLMKVDSLGVIQFQKTFGAFNVDQAHSIKETRDSGLVIAGYTNSFGHGGYDMYVIRTNKFGDTIWTKTYGGVDWDFAYSIDTTNDGGYIFTGGTYCYGNGNEDMYLVKIDSNGDTLWTKTFGGNNEDEARSVKQTSDGGYIITGTTKSFGDVNGDIYTIKTDSNGDTLWTYKYDGLLEDRSYDVIENNSAPGFFIVGESEYTGRGLDGISIGLNTLGTQTKLDYWGFLGGTCDDGLHSIAQSASGRFAVTGYTYYFSNEANYLYYLANTEMSFNCGDTYGLDKFDKAYSITNTKDGGYIICGNSSSYSNLVHILLLKIGNDTNCIPTIGVQNVITNVNSIIETDNDFRIFPNPVNNAVYISIGNKDILNSKSFTISITDILGRNYYQEIVENYLNSKPIEINTTIWNTGIYILKVESCDYSVNQKLIIQR